MELASVFKWFAQESRAAAELAHEKAERKIWCRLAEMWEIRSSSVPPGGSSGGRCLRPKRALTNRRPWEPVVVWLMDERLFQVLGFIHQGGTEGAPQSRWVIWRCLENGGCG